ncbi:hypothetical protein LCGC14_1450020 [marine sediment metagenome]|uniref:Uncharacterized protein n=1 Tax=marine sediment metagenome TaxID=412755 RepID=A0A0F9K4E8_9ZZZZ
MEFGEILKKLKKVDIQLIFEDIDKYTEGRHTVAFMVFNVNLLRAVILLAQPDSKNYSISVLNKSFIYPSNPKYEVTLIFLVTSLEIYLRQLFTALLYIKIKESKDFLYEISDIINIGVQKFKDIISIENLEELVNKLFKVVVLNFQDKDFTKAAFKKLSINLVEIIGREDKDLWRRIYSKEEEKPAKIGYIRIRNQLIHKGFQTVILLAKLLDEVFIEKAILDMTKFVYDIESEIVLKYPKKQFSTIYFR